MIPKIAVVTLLLLLAPTSLAHGGPHPLDSDPSFKDLPWAHRHLRSEHHIYNYDAGAFFTLHDYDSNGILTGDEFLKTYGIHPTSPDADKVIASLMKRIPHAVDREVTREEWMQWSRDGGELPDFGSGPGHHGDEEYEYEIHHFEEFHGDEPEGEEKLDHPEDIQHFRLHDLHQAALDREAELEKFAVNPANIPEKFRLP
ncbi:hypothetical protein EX30DRAFT_314272 [Ascodesmis nigricans]|uniref:EF-hand domain-containing protein n=1 Tax=Ascodesmis nigricans TaxID=341454 RepID=A0A4S2N7J6_9PEZI|nr:hypothetical protein EX30DRAFT_314272 [Ascodesmis nigricans]